MAAAVTAFRQVQDFYRRTRAKYDLLKQQFSALESIVRTQAPLQITSDEINQIVRSLSVAQRQLKSSEDILISTVRPKLEKLDKTRQPVYHHRGRRSSSRDRDDRGHRGASSRSSRHSTTTTEVIDHRSRGSGQLRSRSSRSRSRNGRPSRSRSSSRAAANHRARSPGAVNSARRAVPSRHRSSRSRSPNTARDRRPPRSRSRSPQKKPQFFGSSVQRRNVGSHSSKSAVSFPTSRFSVTLRSSVTSPSTTSSTGATPCGQPLSSSSRSPNVAIASSPKPGDASIATLSGASDSQATSASTEEISSTLTTVDESKEVRDESSSSAGSSDVKTLGEEQPISTSSLITASIKNGKKNFNTSHHRMKKTQSAIPSTNRNKFSASSRKDS